MSFRDHVLTAICVVIALLNYQATSAQGTPKPEIQEFVSKYAEASHSPLFENYKSTYYDSTVTTAQATKGAEIWEDSIQGDFWKHVSKSPNGSERIQGRNANYSFSLQKKNSGYLLTDITHRVEFSRLHAIFVWPFADRWAARSLSDIFSDPSTNFYRLRRTIFQNQEAIEVGVGYPVISRSNETSSREITRKVRYYLHSENYLLLGTSAYAEDIPYDYFAHTILSYTPQFEAIERIVDVLVSENGVSNEIRHRSVIEVRKMRPEAINQDECYLSYYGLPEPIGEPSRNRSNFWAWVVAGSVGFLGAILGIRTYRRRKS